MRLKLNGQQFQQDLSIQAHAAQMGVSQGWRGTHDETLEFYRRITRNWLGDARYRMASYDRHFDMALMNRAIRAMDALLHSLEVSE